MSQSPWHQTMVEEFQALMKKNTWELVPASSDHHLIRCKWFYKPKHDSNEAIVRYKRCLVAKGYSQQLDLNFQETFSLVIKMTTIHLVIVLAMDFGWKIEQLDVKNSFLHGILLESICMTQPQGFVDSLHLTHVCRVKKAIYGHRQAPRSWYSRFSRFIVSLGFKVCHSDHSLFVRHNPKSVVILLIYVDDILVTGSNSSEIQSLLHSLYT